MPVPSCTAEICFRFAHASPDVTVRPQTPEGFLGRHVSFPEKLQPHQKLPEGSGWDWLVQTTHGSLAHIWPRIQEALRAGSRRCQDLSHGLIQRGSHWRGLWADGSSSVLVPGGKRPILVKVSLKVPANPQCDSGLLGYLHGPAWGVCSAAVRALELNRGTPCP